MTSSLWTHGHARLQYIRSTPEDTLNWVFLPGGPGLGSESLLPLTRLLVLPGTIWHLDLPGDGSNVQVNQPFSSWQEALIEAVHAFENVILVAHSTGGMYALATPELQKALVGLVLMDSAPDMRWQEQFLQFTQKNPLPNLTQLQKAYSEAPSNERLKCVTLASVPYLSNQENGRKQFSFLEDLPYNFRACEWSDQHFDSTYKAKLIPHSFPTLIFAGEHDRITPLKLFIESESFHHVNIVMRTISNGGHFPWIENPSEVVDLFQEYYQLLRSSR